MAGEPVDRRGLLDDLFSAPPVDPSVQRRDLPRAPSSRTALEEAQQVTPDEAARHRQVAAELGVPAETVAGAPDDAERLARDRRLDTLLGGLPVTDRFLTDPGNARLASDSVEQLGFLESLVNSLSRSWLGLKQSGRQVLAEEAEEKLRDTQRSYGQILEDVQRQNDPLGRLLLPEAGPSPQGVLGPAGPLVAHSEALYRWARSRMTDPRAAREEFLQQQLYVGRLVLERAEHPMSGEARDFLRRF